MSRCSTAAPTSPSARDGRQIAGIRLGNVLVLRAHRGALLIDVGVVEIGLGQRAADRLGARARRHQRQPTERRSPLLAAKRAPFDFATQAIAAPTAHSRPRRLAPPLIGQWRHRADREARKTTHARRSQCTGKREVVRLLPALNSTPNLLKIQASVAFLRHPDRGRRAISRRAARGRAITLPRSKCESRRPLETPRDSAARVSNSARRPKPVARRSISAASGAPVARVDPDQPAVFGEFGRAANRARPRTRRRRG